MFVVGTSFWASYIVTMGVHSGVSRGFAFPYILRFGAKGAVGQVDRVSASAVEIVEYV